MSERKTNRGNLSTAEQDVLGGRTHIPWGCADRRPSPLWLQRHAPFHYGFLQLFQTKEKATHVDVSVDPFLWRTDGNVAWKALNAAELSVEELQLCHPAIFFILCNWTSAKAQCQVWGLVPVPEIGDYIWPLLLPIAVFKTLCCHFCLLKLSFIAHWVLH